MLPNPKARMIVLLAIFQLILAFFSLVMVMVKGSSLSLVFAISFSGVLAAIIHIFNRSSHKLSKEDTNELSHLTFVSQAALFLLLLIVGLIFVFETGWVRWGVFLLIVFCYANHFRLISVCRNKGERKS